MILISWQNSSSSHQEQWGTLVQVEKNEVELNKLQPPDKVMNAIGVKPGMIIGDIGAGAGRWSVLLAVRVGPEGKILANDIDENGLKLIRERCRKYNIPNIETIQGTVEETGFPERSLDMAFMVYVYHHLEKPISLMKKLHSKLKKNGTVVIITGDPDKGVWKGLPDKEELRKQFNEAGYELIHSEDFLPRDYLLILRPKSENPLQDYL
jgi:ubiquinone/menaquinone biosynthesis C-methylase UbiE